MRQTEFLPGRRIEAINTSGNLNKSLSILCVITVTLLFGAFKAGAIIDAALQMQLGNPSGATADTNNHTHFLIQRPIEAMDYNDTLGELGFDRRGCQWRGGSSGQLCCRYQPADGLSLG